MQFKLIQHLNDDDNDENDMFDDFEFFEKELRRIFDISKEEKTAERIIQHIIQKTSASNYVIKF